MFSSFFKAILDEKDSMKSLCNGHDDGDDSSDDETIEVFGKRLFFSRNSHTMHQWLKVVAANGTKIYS